MRSLALLLLGGLAVLAALTFLNVARLEVNATLPPVSKNLNLSVYPLASARWAPSDIYNVTYYGVKFVPGWPELYTVGYFVPRDPGWSARLEAVARSGAGQYAIALGGQVQITESQNAGPYVPIAGATPLDWRILATQRFSILARAWFSQGGATAVQLVNFTAEPMSKLYQQTFYCGASQLYDDFSKYCNKIYDGFAYSSLPSNVQTYTRGREYTQVYISPRTSPISPPSLVTEVDAYGAGNNPSADWGAAIAVYWLPSPVPAYGTKVSVWGRYVRDAGDVQNNVAYPSIGVDTDSDGLIDKEYIIYRYDTASSNGAIVSAFFREANRNPVYVCTVSSAGTCTPTDSRFVVVNAGPMATGNNYQWSYTLYEQGAVVAVAFVVVDASYYASGTGDDFWMYWDDLTIEYSACPPPADWSVSGRYVWQSYNYLLVTGSATAYMPLVANALTYVANFSGVGTYAVFDSSLNEVFGVAVSCTSFIALCGGVSTPLGSLPAARWVELRPLNGLGDIIRDQYGAILARYGCRYTAAPQYAGFRGGFLRVYNVTALGVI
jgi:hypothetical protein